MNVCFLFCLFALNARPVANSPLASGRKLDTQSYKSLLTIQDDKDKGNKKETISAVHPHTNFDADNTPAASEDEDDHAKKAQDLDIYLSPVDQAVPNRGIQTIIRGDFHQLEKEAEEGTRRIRKYLVATDLSDEALYALEWTMGTILRDGDTLYIVYAIEENASSSKSNDMDSSSPQSINDGTEAMKDATEVITFQTETTAGNKALAFSPDLSRSRASQRTDATEARQMSKGAAERQTAIERIKQNCIRLLRKTKLEVRVALEVIHCKNPKHLILEAVCGQSRKLLARY